MTPPQPTTFHLRNSHDTARFIVGLAAREISCQYLVVACVVVTRGDTDTNAAIARAAEMGIPVSMQWHQD